MMQETDTIIIGAGPIGLELAVALKRSGVDYLHLDAGQIGQTISWYPRQVKFFSSPERIALAGLPLLTTDQSKATREEYLTYLRMLVQHFDLQVLTYHRVVAIRKEDDGFVLTVHHGSHTIELLARHVVLAIGDMHHPRLLHVPGEEMEHVAHYFDEPHRFFRQKLLIVGGRNSAAEAAIRCYRAGAQVTLSCRRPALDEASIKYWLLPELKWLIEKGHIAFHPSTCVSRITRSHVHLVSSPGSSGQWSRDIPADFVLLMTGYEMDLTLLKQLDVALAGKNNAPVLDEATMQTSVPGLFVAGTAAAGTQVHFRLFIENCHAHVQKIAAAITGKPNAGVFPQAGVLSRDLTQFPES